MEWGLWGAVGRDGGAKIERLLRRGREEEEDADEATVGEEVVHH